MSLNRWSRKAGALLPISLEIPNPFAHDKWAIAVEKWLPFNNKAKFNRLKLVELAFWLFNLF